MAIDVTPKSNSSGTMMVNITSLMDVLTIILIFLLLNYSNEAEKESPPSYIELPGVVGKTLMLPKDLAVVNIGRDRIVINGEERPFVSIPAGFDIGRRFAPEEEVDEAYRIALVGIYADNAEMILEFTDAKFLAQGTLYPDVIESVSPFEGPSATIKSHHNVGGLPDDLDFELVEPLRFLFKDEARLIGKELGLPDEIVHRQPFPGPGLGIRIIGDITRERLDTLREADAIVREELQEWDRHHDVWQGFAVLLPVRSVGVQGDQRTYEATAALRIVESIDGMTANWMLPPQEILARISSRICNEVKGINRVVLDISSKPPSTIEWE